MRKRFKNYKKGGGIVSHKSLGGPIVFGGIVIIGKAIPIIKEPKK